jgi:hypothetical protein
MKDAIKEAVRAHYAASEEALLLSHLGTKLRDEGSWPDGEARSLAEFIEEEIPEVSVVRDKEVSAYVVVVPADKEDLARQAIELHKSRHLLRRLPKALLLAFFVDNQGVPVSVTRTPPFKYALGEGNADAIPLPDKYRFPGKLFIQVQNLSPAEVRELSSNVKDWAHEAGIDLDALIRADRTKEAPREAFRQAPAAAAASALERLFAAQLPDVAARMIVPFDIAVALGRLP